MKIVRRGLEITHVSPAGEELLRYRLDLLGQVTTIPHSGSSLRIVAFSDWRVQDIRELIRFIKAQKKRPDLILYAGDDVKRFRPAGRNLFQQIGKLSANGLCAVAGNDDPPACRDLIAGQHVYAVHSCALVLGRFAVVGAEGAPLFQNDTEHRNMGHLLYPERVCSADEALANLGPCKQKAYHRFTRPSIWRFGFPSAVRDPKHGSRPLREFLEAAANSLLCVCGHVHRCGGQCARAGNCVVVNAASHDSPGDAGKVAIIDVRNGRVSAVNWHPIT